MAASIRYAPWGGGAALSTRAGLLQLKEYHRALDEYLQTTNVRHNYPEAWLGSGLCYARIQNPVGTEDAFKQVLNYRPEYPEAIYNLGILYFEQKKDDLPIAHLKRAIEASDAYPRAYYASGVVCMSAEIRKKKRKRLIERRWRSIRIYQKLILTWDDF